jgi:hypothetical protein
VALIVSDVALTTAAAELEKPAAVVRMHERPLSCSLEYFLTRHFANVYAVAASLHATQLSRVVCELHTRHDQVWIRLSILFIKLKLNKK